MSFYDRPAEYNSTLLRYDTLKRRVVSMCMAHVDDDGFVLRSSAIQCTGVEGTREYHDRYVEDSCRFLGEYVTTMFVPGARMAAIFGNMKLPADAEPVAASEFERSL